MGGEMTILPRWRVTFAKSKDLHAFTCMANTAYAAMVVAAMSMRARKLNPEDYGVEVNLVWG